ncbi:MAG: alanine--tRNA ligase-related protein [Candidatus Hermodarchaeota archaeon]
MTEKLYWDTPYDTTFTAKILEITPDGIILDKTLFYPEGGNQVSDKGVIISQGNTFEVDHASKKEEVIIHHISEPFGEKLRAGDKIEGKIDWEYRYGVMRAHSSQHILSAIFKNLLNIDTIRANISFEEISIHISKSVNEKELINILTHFFNICTIKNLQFHSKIIPKNEIKEMGKQIRGGITADTMLRIIEIEDYDINCCGGTHLASSSEVGPIFFYEIKKGREFKYYVGNKAIKLLSKQNIESVGLAGTLNVSIKILYNTLKTQVFKLREENEKLMVKALELIAISPSTSLKGINIGVVDFEIDYKLLAKAFKNFPPNYLLIMKPGNNKIQILSNNEILKADEIIKGMIKKFGGKGGGSPRSAQATLESEPINIISQLELND